MADPAADAAANTTPAKVLVSLIPSIYAKSAIPVVLRITATICNGTKYGMMRLVHSFRCLKIHHM